MAGRPVTVQVRSERGATGTNVCTKRGSVRGSGPRRKEGTTRSVIVHVPMHFQRRGGRKAVIASPRGDVAAAKTGVGAGLDPVLSALARAFYWRKLIDTGACPSIAEIAARESLSAAYVSRLMRLTLLKPETVPRLLKKRAETGAIPALAVLTRPMSVVWERRTVGT